MEVTVNPDSVILKLKQKLSDAHAQLALTEVALDEALEREAQLQAQVLSLQHDPDAPE